MTPFRTVVCIGVQSELALENRACGALRRLLHVEFLSGATSLERVDVSKAPL